MTSEAGRRLTLQHKEAQRRLGIVTAAALHTAWETLDGTDLDGTTREWLDIVVPIITAAYARSAQLAAAYLAAFRLLEVGQAVPPVLPPPLSIPAVTTSVTVTGPVSVKSAIHRGVPLPRAMDVARSAHAAAGQRHCLDGGRQTIKAATAADPRARGFSRVVSSGACRYCSDLAGITFGTNKVFKAHDGCSCTAEPVYR